MRSGIPITARLFALASMFSGKGASAESTKAQKQLNGLREQRISSAGTDQRRRRKLNRAKLGGKRR